MANTAELSPIWRSLPYDLVQEILDHFTDDVIASCDYNDDLCHIPHGQYRDTGQLYQHWQAFRQDSLFKFQKRRFEQHFRDRWLTNMTLYLELDLGRGTGPLLCYCRYIPFSDMIVKDTNDILQGTFTEEQGEHRDSDSETVTFVLHGPVMSEEYIQPEVYLFEYDEFMDSHDLLLPILVSRAWEEIFDNDGEGDKAVWFAVGLMSDDRFRLWRTSDGIYSWIAGIEAAGLEVFEEGRRIQFRWKRLMTDFLMERYSARGRRNYPGTVTDRRARATQIFLRGYR